jgi:hypothetical protein
MPFVTAIVLASKDTLGSDRSGVWSISYKKKGDLVLVRQISRLNIVDGEQEAAVTHAKDGCSGIQPLLQSSARAFKRCCRLVYRCCHFPRQVRLRKGLRTSCFHSSSMLKSLPMCKVHSVRMFHQE